MSAPVRDGGEFESSAMQREMSRFHKLKKFEQCSYMNRLRGWHWCPHQCRDAENLEQWMQREMSRFPKPKFEHQRMNAAEC